MPTKHRKKDECIRKCRLQLSLSNPDLSNSRKMSTRTLFFPCLCRCIWNESDISVFSMCLCVNSIGCSPPLLPIYALSFIFHIPPSWHLLLCRVLHGWQIEFTQIKQSLCGAVSWEMMHVEKEGISIQISHTHELSHYCWHPCTTFNMSRIYFLYIFPPPPDSPCCLHCVCHHCWNTQIYCVRHFIAVYNAYKEYCGHVIE